MNLERGNSVNWNNRLANDKLPSILLVVILFQVAGCGRPYENGNATSSILPDKQVTTSSGLSLSKVASSPKNAKQKGVFGFWLGSSSAGGNATETPHGKTYPIMSWYGLQIQQDRISHIHKCLLNNRLYVTVATSPIEKLEGDAVMVTTGIKKDRIFPFEIKDTGDVQFVSDGPVDGAKAGFNCYAELKEGTIYYYNKSHDSLRSVNEYSVYERRAGWDGLFPAEYFPEE
jgi:hypothetical protein